MRFTRITLNPNKMGGVPTIRNLRVPVSTVVQMTAEGMTQSDIIKHMPDLKPADIREALEFAALAMQEQALPLIKA